MCHTDAFMINCFAVILHGSPTTWKAATQVSKPKVRSLNLKMQQTLPHCLEAVALFLYLWLGYLILGSNQNQYWDQKGSSEFYTIECQQLKKISSNPTISVNALMNVSFPIVVSIFNQTIFEIFCWNTPTKTCFVLIDIWLHEFNLKH